MTRQVLVAVALYCTHSITDPMQVPPAEGRPHRWPPWVRLGLVMKPTAGNTAGVTPRQPTAASAVEATAAVAGAGRDWLAGGKVTPGNGSATPPVPSRAASHRPDSRPLRGAGLARKTRKPRKTSKSRLTPGSP